MEGSSNINLKNIIKKRLLTCWITHYGKSSYVKTLWVSGLGARFALRAGLGAATRAIPIAHLTKKLASEKVSGDKPTR